MRSFWLLEILIALLSLVFTFIGYDGLLFAQFEDSLLQLIFLDLHH